MSGVNPRAAGQGENDEATGAYLVPLHYASGRPYVIVRCDDHPAPLLINSGHHYDATEPHAHAAIDRHNAEYHASGGGQHEKVSLCRDEDCPECGYPETFAEVDFSQPTPGADAIGCHRCGWRVEAPS